MFSARRAKHEFVDRSREEECGKPTGKDFLVGTAEYMEPELVVVNQSLAPAVEDIGATDVYSFGVFLWEMSAQQSPYKDCNFEAINENGESAS